MGKVGKIAGQVAKAAAKKTGAAVVSKAKGKPSGQSTANDASLAGRNRKNHPWNGSYE